MLSLRLHAAVSAVCPVDGVSIGDDADKSTWCALVKPEATPEQIAAAQAVIAAFDPAAPEVPSVVTPYQARAAINAAGLRSAIEAAVAASQDQNVKDAWEYATAIYRDSPFIAAMQVSIGLSNAQVDQLFIAAGQVQ